MESHYNKLSRKLINYKGIYNYLERIGFPKHELQFLYDDIYKLDSELKEIDKSIGYVSDGGHGNYISAIKSMKLSIIDKIKKWL